MTFVIDASVVTVLALSQRVRVLDRHHPMAPALMWSEAISAIRQVRRRGDIDDSDERAAVESVLDVHIGRRSNDAMYRLAAEIARDLGWAKTYDAEYLALARLEQVPLLTVDDRLRRRAEGIVDVVDPADIFM